MISALKKLGPFFWLAIFICIVYFIIFIFPNYVGSENIAMVAVFEPDESVPLKYAFAMIEPTESLKQALINFAFYDYYFYGFPFFAVSALSLLPIAPQGLIDNIPLVMVTLRQVISVLPMLLSVLMMVYMQTKFKSYKSIVLLLLLLGIPAVVRNNFWWHPDSMVTLMAILTIYFLNKDDLKFGSNFYIAAFLCGYSAGTKGIGFYFFLTIAVYLLLGLLWKKASLRKLFLSALGFLACMAFAYLAANPILVFEGVRKDYFALMDRQSVELYSGYWVLYPKGFFVSLPDLTQYFGHILFILMAVATCVIGIVKKRDRLLNIFILTWAIPLSVLVFLITNFKFQYWIPVALPLFSTLVVYLPDRLPSMKSLRNLSTNGLVSASPQIVISLAVFLQLASYTISDIQRYNSFLHKVDDKPAIQFYNLSVETLTPLPDERVLVYHDVRMYVPPTRNWKTEAVFKPLTYNYVQSKGFDVVLIMQQRIYDYLSSSAEGIHPEEFAQSQILYTDAENETLEGYHLIFRNDFGLIFVRDELYQQYFE